MPVVTHHHLLPRFPETLETGQVVAMSGIQQEQGQQPVRMCRSWLANFVFVFLPRILDSPAFVGRNSPFGSQVAALLCSQAARLGMAMLLRCIHMSASFQGLLFRREIKHCSTCSCRYMNAQATTFNQRSNSTMRLERRQACGLPDYGRVLKYIMHDESR